MIVFDPNIRSSLIDDETAYRARLNEVLRVATILKSSDEDLAWLFPDTTIATAAGYALAAGVSAVVVTAGAQGSTVFTKSFEVAEPAKEVEVVDTIGAGDSFMAALLVWLDESGTHTRDTVEALTETEWAIVLRFAAEVSAVVCSRKGADPPYRAELSE